MSGNDRDAEPLWISLGAAARMLGVKEATIRHWANRGLLRVFRTAGRHRRFLRSQISAFADQAQAGPTLEARQRQEEEALQSIRRRLRRAPGARQAWHENIEEDGRARLRLFGRRLLSLLVPNTAGPRARRDALEEARLLGHEYGLEMAARGYHLTDTLEAFLFFRNSALEALPEGAGGRQAMAVADQTLLGVVEAHERALSESPS